MYNKLIDMTYDRARNVFFSEIDTGGPIGLIWIMQDKDILDRMLVLLEFVDTWNDVKEFPPEPIMFPLTAEDIFNTIIHFNMQLPTHILLKSEYNWNEWISAYIIFMKKVIEIHKKALEYYVSRGIDEKYATREMESLQSITVSFEGVLKLVTIGASYTDLIQAGNYIVQELKSWGQSRPGAVRLSEAYLKAIGFYPDEEPPSMPEPNPNMVNDHMPRLECDKIDYPDQN